MAEKIYWTLTSSSGLCECGRRSWSTWSNGQPKDQPTRACSRQHAVMIRAGEPVELRGPPPQPTRSTLIMRARDRRRNAKTP